MPDRNVGFSGPHPEPTDANQASRGESLDLAQRGLRCGEDDAEVLATAGYLLGYFGEDIDAAISLIVRSLELNPSYARGWRHARALIL
jgi:hypothetical protein